MSFTPSPRDPPRRRTVPVTWLVVSLLVVAGAAVAATAVYYSLRPAGTPGPLTVVDDLGRTVNVPYDPSRVVVFGPSIMDTMYRLGLRDQVVGVDCYSPAFGGLSADYSPDQIALWNLSSSMCVQLAPLEVEQLLNLTPQLVLATTLASVQEVESISSTYHIPVVMLQPPTLSGILVDVSLLGMIFGVASTAAHLNVLLEQELGRVNSFQQNLSSQGATFPTALVTYDTDAEGYWTFGPGTFGESLIELASATSISANATTPYPELAPEQVVYANPTYVIYGTGFGLNESSYATAPGWSSLNATHDGNAIGIESNYLTEPDPTMILEGLPALVAVFYPGEL